MAGSVMSPPASSIATAFLPVVSDATKPFGAFLENLELATQTYLSARTYRRRTQEADALLTT